MQPESENGYQPTLLPTKLTSASPNFNLMTNVYPDLHSDFAQSIELPFHIVSMPAKLEKIKDTFAEVHSHLVQVSTSSVYYVAFCYKHHCSNHSKILQQVEMGMDGV
jgi:hypothetical protein